MQYPLPPEIWIEIICYLSERDFIYLCNANIFLTSFLTHPWFLKKFQKLLFHLLITKDMHKHWSFQYKILTPVLHQSQIYFLINIKKFEFLKQFYLQHYQHRLCIFFNSFKSFTIFSKLCRSDLYDSSPFICQHQCPCSLKLIEKSHFQKPSF